MELEPEPETLLFKSRNWNHNFSKVGTATKTVKNSYGSTTLRTSTGIVKQFIECFHKLPTQVYLYRGTPTNKKVPYITNAQSRYGMS